MGSCDEKYQLNPIFTLPRVWFGVFKSQIYLKYELAYVNCSKIIVRVWTGYDFLCQTIPWVQFGYNLHMPHGGGMGLPVTPRKIVGFSHDMQEVPCSYPDLVTDDGDYGRVIRSPKQGPIKWWLITYKKCLKRRKNIGVTFLGKWSFVSHRNTWVFKDLEGFNNPWIIAIICRLYHNLWIIP